MTTTIDSVFEYYAVKLDASTGVLHVTLNRPKALNSMTRAFFGETAALFNAISGEQRVRCVLLSATGRMFSCGLDLKDAGATLTGSSGGDDDQQNELGLLWRGVAQMQRGFKAVEDCSKPIVTAVHGQCIGGALELVLATDVRFCSADALFSVRETKMAIVADLGMMHRLVRQCGRAWVNLMALTGADVTAADAKAAGVVSHVFATQDELLARALETAKAIAANSPITVQGVKHVLAYSAEHNPTDSLAYVALWNSAFLRNEDLTEAISSFLQRRQPQFNARL